MKDQAADVENTLRTAGFSRPVVSTEQIPAKQKEELEEQIRQIEQTIADIRGEIISYAEDREELKIIGDYYRMRAEKYEVLGTLPQSRRTFIISGYAAKEAIPAIQKGIGDAYDCVIDVEELKEDERRDRSDRDHVILLCIFLWNDVIRCSVWCDHRNRVSDRP